MTPFKKFVSTPEARVAYREIFENRKAQYRRIFELLFAQGGYDDSQIDSIERIKLYDDYGLRHSVQGTTIDQSSTRYSIAAIDVNAFFADTEISDIDPIIFLKENNDKIPQISGEDFHKINATGNYSRIDIEDQMKNPRLYIVDSEYVVALVRF